MKTLTALLGVLMLVAACCPVVQAVDEKTENHPVFLLCPAHERYGSWSLYLKVDKNDPSKVLALGLEELKQHNSKDDGGYLKVLEAQANASTEREQIGTLDAASFGSGSLRVEKNNALNVTCTPAGKDFTLMVDMRISADGHFIIGGKESDRRNVVLKYDTVAKKWNAYATVLVNKDGVNAVGAEPLYVSGILFPVTGTGIFRISVALRGGNGVWVYDGGN
ncbi:MAG: hypothetical protein WCT04_12070 [Planctomycetota bacterium]